MRIATPRAFTVVLILGVLALQPHAATAIERFYPIPLPAAGMGSTVRAVVQTAPQEFYVAGAGRQADGRWVAMVWQIVVDPSDTSGNTVRALQLPTATGTGSEATGIAFLEGDPGQLVIVGNRYPLLAPDRGRATLWTKDAAGNFTNTVLDDEAAVSSQVNAVVGYLDDLIGWDFMAAGSITDATGRSRPCVWGIPAGNPAANRLELLNHSDQVYGSALGLSIGSGRVPHVAGFVERSGRRIATLFTGTLVGSDHAWDVHGLPGPGANSQANGLTVSGRSGDDVLLISGAVAGNGRSQAALWISQGGSPSAFMRLDGPVGFANSAAVAAVFLAGGNDVNNTVVAGDVWNNSVDRRGYLWVVTGVESGSLQLLGSDEYFRHAARAISPGGGALAGEDLAGTQPRATLLVPTTTEFPTVVSVANGTVTAGPHSLTVLDERDGAGLRIRPRNPSITIVIDVDFGPVHSYSRPRVVTAMRLALNGERPAAHNGTWTVEVQRLVSLDTWEHAYSFRVGTAPSELEIGLDWAVNANSTRARLIIRADQPGSWGMNIDRLIISSDLF